MRFVPKVVSRTIGKQVFKAKANSPTILFVAGVGGVVVTTVLASRASMRLEPTLEAAQRNINAAELIRRERPDEYSQAEANAAIAKARRDCAFTIVKSYAPAVVVGALSIAALTKSHTTLTKRNVALGAAYASLAEAYERYRGEVATELGAEREEEIYKGIHDYADESGNRQRGVVWNAGQGSPYSRFFDRTNKHWTNDPASNRYFLERQQQFANDRLHSRGWITLNEVYVSLGMEETLEGMVVGWHEDNPEGVGFVDFGLFDHNGQIQRRLFLEGEESSVLLDFNVDGNIFRFMDGKRQGKLFTTSALKRRK